MIFSMFKERKSWKELSNNQKTKRKKLSVWITKFAIALKTFVNLDL